MSNITLTSEAPTRLASVARRPVLSSPLGTVDTHVPASDVTTATVTDLWIYLQLRAPQRQLATCLTLLQQHLQLHAEARAELVGAGVDGDDVRLVVGVNLGDSLEVKHRPAHVLAAYRFTQSLFESLFNFWPQYLHGTPTAEERAAAARLAACDSELDEVRSSASAPEDDLFADDLADDLVGAGFAPPWID